MMNLYCCEKESECKAYRDSVLLNDDRVLENLLRHEESYTPSNSDFRNVQKEITPEMRKIVAEWMMEVSVEENCQEEVFLLAMNFMDRFLSLCCISKTQLQLLGTACLMLSSKLRQTKPLSAALLALYTDNSITVEELMEWEMLVLSKLKWEMGAVTPQDFLCHILRRLPIARCWDTTMVQRHAQTYIALCARDYKFSTYMPSMIAAASIAAALDGLGWTAKSGYSLNDLFDMLQSITSIERDYLQSCLDQIEEMVNATMNDRNISCNTQPCSNSSVASSSTSSKAAEHSASTSSPSSMDKMQEHGKAGTPTDVRDIHF